MEKILFYQELLSLPDLEVTSVSVSSREITIHCKVACDVTKCECPNCGGMSSIVNQRGVHKVRDLDISGRPVWLHISTRQFICKPCNRYYIEPLSFADMNKSYTHRQAKFVFLLSKKQSYLESAAIVNMTPKTLERLVLAECEEVANLKARYAQVRRIGIDEQSHRKGKGDYFCVITDLDRGVLLDMLPDRKMLTIVAHFQALGPAFCQQITDVSCDIWDAYIGAAKICFPQATVTLDRFHVVKMLNEGLNTFRKDLRKEDKDNVNFRKLKWILYKQYHKLSDKELDIFDAACVDCPTLKVLYHKREAFHHILDNETSVDIAMQKLEEWVASLKKEGITAFDTFVKMLSARKQLVVNYVTNCLSNAVTEGINNLIRSIRRVSFGMTNFEHLRWRVLAISS
jgi:transposase